MAERRIQNQNYTADNRRGAENGDRENNLDMGREISFGNEVEECKERPEEFEGQLVDSDASDDQFHDALEDTQAIRDLELNSPTLKLMAMYNRNYAGAPDSGENITDLLN